MNLSDLRNPYVLRPRFVSANYTAKPGDLCHVDSGTSPLTITLPASPNVDTYVGVWDANNNANANNITIARNGQTIQGLTDDWVINVDSGRVDLVFDGVTWQVAFVTVGGLNQTQVDARVNAIGSGVQTLVLTPDSGLSPDAGGIEATRVAITLGSMVLSAYRFSNSSFEGVSFNWIPPKSWDGGSIRWRPVWVPSTTSAGNISMNVIPYYAGDNEEPNNPGAIAGKNWASHESTTKIHIGEWTNWGSAPFEHDDFVNFRFYGRGGSMEWTTSAQADVAAIEFQYNTITPTDD